MKTKKKNTQNRFIWMKLCVMYFLNVDLYFWCMYSYLNVWDEKRGLRWNHCAIGIGHRQWFSTRHHSAERLVRNLIDCSIFRYYEPTKYRNNTRVDRLRPGERERVRYWTSWILCGEKNLMSYALDWSGQPNCWYSRWYLYNAALCID